MKLLVIGFILAFLLITGCSKYPKDVNEALKQAENNRIELESVILHYNRYPKDSLKLKAAYFLIGNMPDQYYFEGHSLDVYNQEIYKMKDKSVTKLKNMWDSLQLVYGNDLVGKRDIEIVDAGFLIENIDMAFKAWNMPWAKHLSFSDFCEYLLPYKSSNEKPEYWRTSLFKNYRWVLDSVKDVNNQIEVCNMVNSKLRDWYSLSLDYDYPVDIGYKMATIIKTGSCDMSSKIELYPMRAIGVPAVFDYTPFWANRSGKHNWNSVIINGKPCTFQGGENNVGSHKVETIGIGRMKFKRSKVFRKTFNIQKNSLAMINNGQEEIPGLFENKRFNDVSKDYLPVSDIHLVFEKKGCFNRKYAYLATFNNRDWQIVYWGVFKKASLIFKDMAREVVYLPVIYQQEENIPIGNPFILTKEGGIQICEADMKRKQTVKVIKKYPEDESNNIFKGDTYELLFWKNGWISLGMKHGS